VYFPLNVQLWITLVIFMGMVETATMFFDYLDWNSTVRTRTHDICIHDAKFLENDVIAAKGTRVFGLTLFGVFVGVCKRALSRISVLMVSLGYGIVKVSTHVQSCAVFC
jgi:hypothetical protein